MNVEAWKAVEAEIEVTRKLHLRELFLKDSGRASRFTAEAAGWTLDYSKNRITAALMKKLIGLAEASDLKRWIDAMFAGEAINETENRPVLHTALRSRPDRSLLVGGKDVVAEVHTVLKAMSDFSDRVRKGKWLGHTGKRIKYVVNIGIGGSDLGPAMACQALKPYSKRSVAMYFVSNVDGRIWPRRSKR
jgi:glucose-6-phosphate isomerase